MRRLIDNGTTSPARPPYIGHYGHLRKAYLEGYRPDLYTALVASEKLYEHCAEIDAAARSLIDLIMPELAKSAGATEELKAAAPMKWVGLMNACKAQAEELHHGVAAVYLQDLAAPFLAVCQLNLTHLVIGYTLYAADQHDRTCYLFNCSIFLGH